MRGKWQARGQQRFTQSTTGNNKLLQQHFINCRLELCGLNRALLLGVENVWDSVIKEMIYTSLL